MAWEQRCLWVEERSNDLDFATIWGRGMREAREWLPQNGRGGRQWTLRRR